LETVAAHGWGKNSPVDEWLYDEPYRFDFFQAVRLLELADEARGPVGEGAEPAREAVRFKSAVGLAFPASDVAEVERRSGGGAHGAAARMTVNFMGLAGALGPLHTPSTELIIESAWNRDTAFRDFLDIFNHRLVSLLYRIRKLHRVGLDHVPPGEDSLATQLYSVVGLGTENLRGRMQVKDRALLFYAGLIGQQPRSMTGLERLLADYFRVGVRGRQFVGRWLALEEGQWTRIGATGQNRGLGRDALVGTRVWEQQGAFELSLGPLKLDEFLDFLPTGWAFRPLCDLVRFYVGDEADFSFRLTLKASEIPSASLGGTQGGARLSAKDGARLGWTSRLNSRWNRDDSQVVVSPASLRAFAGAVSIPAFGLPPDKLAELVAVMTPRKFEANRPVVRQGDAGDSLFVIRRGSVKIVRLQDDGREVSLGTLREGEHFGEMSLIMRKARNASVFTLQECELLELHKTDLEAFMAKYPRFGAALRAYAEGRMYRGKR
jgi:type VI secretion system protein ImpH